MARRIQKILDAEKFANMKYPKVGEPLETIAVENVGSSKNTIPKVSPRFMPHIIDFQSEFGNSGRFLNYWVETEERCWEITMQEIAKLKKELGSIRKY